MGIPAEAFIEKLLQDGFQFLQFYTDATNPT
jgi:hypothetical protein